MWKRKRALILRQWTSLWSWISAVMKPGPLRSSREYMQQPLVLPAKQGVLGTDSQKANKLDSGFPLLVSILLNSLCEYHGSLLLLLGMLHSKGKAILQRCPVSSRIRWLWVSQKIILSVPDIIRGTTEKWVLAASEGRNLKLRDAYLLASRKQKAML